MKRYKLMTVYLLLLTVFIMGCSEQKADDSPPKRAIDSYLEGLRDRDPDKIYKVVTFEAYRQLQFPGKLDKVFQDQAKLVGNIENWEFIDKPYIDELNNQALIKTKIKATKGVFVLEFDIRRRGSTWFMYGAEQVNTGTPTNIESKYKIENFK